MMLMYEGIPQTKIAVGLLRLGTRVATHSLLYVVNLVNQGLVPQAAFGHPWPHGQQLTLEPRSPWRGLLQEHDTA